jgi:hypothetical protein
MLASFLWPGLHSALAIRGVIANIQTSNAGDGELLTNLVDWNPEIGRCFIIKITSGGCLTLTVVGALQLRRGGARIVIAIWLALVASPKSRRSDSRT